LTRFAYFFQFSFGNCFFSLTTFPRQIYRIVNKNIKPDGSVQGANGNSGYFQGPKFTAPIPEIKSFVRYQQNMRDYKTGTEIKTQKIFYTDSSFFSAFSFPFSSFGASAAKAAFRPITKLKAQIILNNFIRVRNLP